MGNTQSKEDRLINAAGDGNLDVVKSMLFYGANVDAKNSIGWTALMFASAYGHKAIVELLLEKGADINTKSSNGWTALTQASLHGQKDIVELLLANKADINTKSLHGWTALTVASHYGGTTHKEIVKILEDFVRLRPAGTKPIIPSKDAILAATKNGDIDQVRKLISANVDLDVKRSDGWTALMIAAHHSRLNILKFLLEAGADTEIEDRNGYTALMQAVVNGRDKYIVEELEKYSRSSRPKTTWDKVLKEDLEEIPNMVEE